ncbi:MAG: helix-turn-helix domain-containing protein [Polyangiaceae bacterium]
MARSAAPGLNDPVASGVARMVRGGALHHSCRQSTSRHAHYAWKIHVGIDAPVWLECASGAVPVSAGARVVVVPPGVAHSTGAAGWSCAVFVQPGMHGSGWSATSDAFALGGKGARRLLDACRHFDLDARADTAAFIQELAGPVLSSLASPAVDRRVQSALVRLRSDADVPLDELARDARVSSGRLSRLVTQATGMRLRQHVLWARLLGMLSSRQEHGTIAAAALTAGFADHAHLTRTCREFLGRTPSELGSPDVIEPW